MALIALFVASFVAGLILQSLFKRIAMSISIPFLLYVSWSIYHEFFTPYRGGGASFWPLDIFFAGPMALGGGFLGGYAAKSWAKYFYLQLLAGVVAGVLSIWGLWGPGWILQHKAHDLVGASESKVMEVLGPPHRIVTAEEAARSAPQKPWWGPYSSPGRMVTGKAWLYYETDDAVVIYLDDRGTVEYVAHIQV